MKKPTTYFNATILTSLLLLGALSTLVGRGIFADGSFFLANILKSNSFFAFDKPRLIAQLTTQAPVVMALRLGVTDIPFIIKLYSFCLCAIPLIIWGTALIHLRKSSLLPSFVVILGVTCLNGGFFAIGEYNITFAWCGLASAILLRGAEINKFHAIALIIAAASLTLSYEIMVFFGPLLFSLTLFRLLNTGKPNALNLIQSLLAFALFLFACSFAVSAWSIAYPRSTENLSGATSLGSVFLNRQFAISSTVGLLYVFSYTIRFLGIRLPGKSISLFCGVLACFPLFIPKLWATPEQNYTSRAFIGLVFFAMIALLALPAVAESLRLKGRSALRVNFKSGTILVPSFIYLALSISTVYSTIGYARFINKFDHEVNTNQGLILLKDSPLNKTSYAMYGWAWTYPWMSLLLQDSKSAAVIDGPSRYNGILEYDPKNPPQFLNTMTKGRPLINCQALDSLTIFDNTEWFHYGATEGHKSTKIDFKCGWSYPELDFRWSDAIESKFYFKIKPKADIQAAIKLKFKVFEKQRISICVNGRLLSEKTYANPGFPSYSELILIPSGLLSDSVNEVSFIIPDSKSPTTGDARKLGLAFESISIQQHQ